MSDKEGILHMQPSGRWAVIRPRQEPVEITSGEPILEDRMLRYLIWQRGFTQREIARLLGVTEALVSMWWHGRRKPGLIRMAALRQLYLDTRSESERASDERVKQMVQILRDAFR